MIRQKFSTLIVTVCFFSSTLFGGEMNVQNTKEKIAQQTSSSDLNEPPEGEPVTKPQDSSDNVKNKSIDTKSAQSDDIAPQEEPADLIAKEPVNINLERPDAQSIAEQKTDAFLRCAFGAISALLFLAGYIATKTDKGKNTHNKE